LQQTVEEPSRRGRRVEHTGTSHVDGESVGARIELVTPRLTKRVGTEHDDRVTRRHHPAGLSASAPRPS
jgi:hypothetical protein